MMAEEEGAGVSSQKKPRGQKQRWEGAGPMERAANILLSRGSCVTDNRGS